jgi:hypothetical protein
MLRRETARFSRRQKIYDICFLHFLLLFTRWHVKLSTIKAKAERIQTRIVAKAARSETYFSTNAEQKEALYDPYCMRNRIPLL